MKTPIFALNPNEPESKISIIADWCNENQFGHYKLLYAASVLALEGLIYEAPDDRMLLLGRALFSLPTDKHRFLAVSLVLKALITTYRPHLMWLSRYEIMDSAAVSPDLVNRLARTCRQRGLSLTGLLDVALCRANTEELVKFDEKDAETYWINCDLLTESADMAKFVGRQLYEETLEDRVGMLLKITRAMCRNILGSCGGARDDSYIN